MKAEKQKKINGIFIVKCYDERILMMDDIGKDLRQMKMNGQNETK